MSKPKSINITVPGWEKFNPRGDLKATSWFRLQNTIFEDPQFYDLTQLELLFWFYILCLASKSQSGELTIHVTHALRVGRFDEKTIFSALEKLEHLQCVVTRDVDVTQTLRARHTTDGRTDERTGSNEQTSLLLAEYPTDFVEIKKQLNERKLTSKALGTLLESYPEPVWLVSEFRKMFVWEEMNPRKKKKNFGPFAARWLAKGWDDRKLPAGQAGTDPSKFRRVGP